MQTQTCEVMDKGFSIEATEGSSSSQRGYSPVWIPPKQVCAVTITIRDNPAWAVWNTNHERLKHEPPRMVFHLVVRRKGTIVFTTLACDRDEAANIIKSLIRLWVEPVVSDSAGNRVPGYTMHWSALQTH